MASTGLALSLTFSSATASPLVLVGLLVAVFLGIEARRYCFFDFWRVRAHILETQFMGPILLGPGVNVTNGWNRILYDDGRKPRLRISFWDAVGRRLRKNYAWIFAIQAAAYLGKLLIHPTPVASLADLSTRAAVGPVAGELVPLAGFAYDGTWVALALLTRRSSRGRGQWRTRPTEDHVLELARQAT